MKKQNRIISRSEILKARQKLHDDGISRSELAAHLGVDIGAVHYVLGRRIDLRAVRGDARKVAVYLGLRPEDKFAGRPPVPSLAADAVQSAKNS